MRTAQRGDLRAQVVNVHAAIADLLEPTYDVKRPTSLIKNWPEHALFKA
jgi:hypothetical protein